MSKRFVTDEGPGEERAQEFAWIEYDQEGWPQDVMCIYEWDHTKKPWFRPGKDRPKGWAYRQCDFDFCRRDQRLYWHESGAGGGTVDDMYLAPHVTIAPPPRTIWAAPYIVFVEYISHAERRRVVTNTRFREMGFKRLDEPRRLPMPFRGVTRDPFKASEESEMVYCEVCNDHFPGDWDDDVCEHVWWDEDRGWWAGPGVAYERAASEGDDSQLRLKEELAKGENA